jgi:transcriptional regulator with XRE-family HTH domain
MAMPNHDLYRCALALLICARKAQGMSGSGLAEKLGVAQDFVAQYEAGSWRLDPAEYVTIGRAVGVDPYELLQQAGRCRWRLGSDNRRAARQCVPLTRPSAHRDQ